MTLGVPVVLLTGVTIYYIFVDVFVGSRETRRHVICAVDDGPACKSLLLFRLPNQELSLARRALRLALKHGVRTAHHLNLPDAFGDLRLLVKALGQAFRKRLVGLGPICVHK